MTMQSDKSTLKSFTTGGDLIFHRLQLFFSNLLRLVLVGASVCSISFGVFVHFFVTKYQWHVTYKTFIAKTVAALDFMEYHQDILKPNGDMMESVSSQNLLELVSQNHEMSAAFAHVAWLGSVSFFLGIGVMVVLIAFYLRIGSKAQTDDFLRGQKIVSSSELSSKVKNPSPIKIANVHIPQPLLPRNLLCVGSMGTGKSQAIFQMIEDARGWGKKMVIYDKTGEITQKFFRPGIDVLLNPVDARCADWSIFADLCKTTDAAMVSRFFVPENKNSSDPVWDNAARMLLEDLITIVRNKGGTMANVREIITQYPLVELHALLVANGAASVGVINPENAKGSESIRLTLTAQPAIRFFQFFDKKSSSFSVREFVRREDDACLFLVSNSTLHESVKPFISAWLELALVEAMSLEPTDDIRLIFVLDELASLSKLKVLDVAFTEARKYGIVSIVGIQNLSQMDEIYGEDLTKVFVANLQNKLILRTEEESSATRMADTLGKEEIEEVNESNSFGVESSRDGVSLSGKRLERHLVTPTQITILPDLTGYLKIAGDYPLAKVVIKYKSRKNHELAFIERDGLSLPPIPSLPDHAVATVVAPIDDMPSESTDETGTGLY